MDTNVKIIDTRVKNIPENFIAQIDEKSCAMQARKKFLDYLKKLEQCHKEGK